MSDKTGRNELCPCGSGAKYKHCCLRKERHRAANTNSDGTRDWTRRLAESIEEGFDADRAGDTETAADVWLDGWAGIRDKIPAEVSTLGQLERMCDCDRSLVSWFWRCLDALRSLSRSDEDYGERGAEFVADVLRQFPGESDANRRNMRADRGLLLAGAGIWEEAREEFERLVDDYPDSAAGYVTWADALLHHHPSGAVEALEVLERARDRPVDDAGDWDLGARIEEAREFAGR